MYERENLCLFLIQIAHTEVAEQLVSELQEECDLQELSKHDRKQLEIETERLSSRLEHARAQNTVLQLTLEETKNHCERSVCSMYTYTLVGITLVIHSLRLCIIHSFQFMHFIMVAESNALISVTYKWGETFTASAFKPQLLI